MLITCLMASLGSDPEDFLAAVRDSTSSISTQTRDLRGEGSWHRPLGQIKKKYFKSYSLSSISLLISVNIFCTSLPDSENHLENRLWELISTNWPLLKNFPILELQVSSKLNQVNQPDDKFLGQSSAQASLSSAWRPVKKNHPTQFKVKKTGKKISYP